MGLLSSHNFSKKDSTIFFNTCFTLNITREQSYYGLWGSKQHLSNKQQDSPYYIPMHTASAFARIKLGRPAVPITVANLLNNNCCAESDVGFIENPPLKNSSLIILFHLYTGEGAQEIHYDRFSVR